MKYLYTLLICIACGQAAAHAQNGGFLSKIKDVFSSEVKTGAYTFKDGSVYTWELVKGRPNGKGRTVFKNGDVYEGGYVK